jgi:hypothetical protein
MALKQSGGGPKVGELKIVAIPGGSVKEFD